MSDFKGKFTELFLKNLKAKVVKAPPEKEYDLREREGFGIRVRRTGAIIFFYMYTFDRKRKFMRLGTYPQDDVSPQGVSLAAARQKHVDALSKVMAGIDPLEQSAPEEDQQRVTEILTVAQLKTLYMEHITLNLVPRSVNHQDSTLEKHLITALGTRPVDSVRRADAIALVESIAKSTRGAANNCIKAGRAMFEFGVLREYLTVNPFIKITRAVPQARAKSRSRNLSPDEIRILWNELTLGYGSSEVKRILKLVLLLGQRPGEVAAMRREHIEGDWWTIPKEETKIGKNPNIAEDLKFDQRIYLSSLAKELIGAGEGEFVFAAREGRPVTEGALSGHVRKEVVGGSDGLRKAAHYGLRPWVPHDLRRTMATRVVDDLSAPHEYVNAILGHLIPGVLGIYVRSRYDAQKKELALAWERRLLEIVRNPLPSPVIVPTVAPRRVLTDEEIRVVWRGLSSLNSAHSSGALKFILVSGQSVGACAGFSRADTVSDTTGMWWQLESNKVYLTDAALQLVGNKEGYAFAPRKGGSHINIATLSYHILNNESFGLPKWTPEDLRATVASKIRELGAPAGVVSAFLQGSPANPWELRHWLTCWEKALLRIVSLQ